MVRRLSVLALMCAAALSGCGDDSQSAANSAANTLTGANSSPATSSSEAAPTISGTPIQKIIAMSRYTFTPSARVFNGHALSFTIQNKPTWADFNAGSGELSGTPDTAAVGTFDHIVIAASDGQKSVALKPFHITVAADSDTPSIDGEPDTSVVAGDAFRFEPNVSDAGDSTLTFTISNKPTWATFDTTTGELSGKPTVANVGTTSDILITVSNGSTSAALPAFDLAVTEAATATGSAMVSWEPPTQNTDGSALSDLAGYKIYYGTNAKSLDKSIDVKSAGLTSFQIDGLAATTWYFAVKAYTSSKAESDLSSKVSKTIT